MTTTSHVVNHKNNQSSNIIGQVWAPPVDEETRKCLDTLRKKFDALPPAEREWCSDDCLLRYLRARNKQVDKAWDLLQRTLNWRKSFGVEDIIHNVSPQIREEGASGKLYVGGNDQYGRPVIYMKPRFQNTKENQYQLQHLVYTLERAIRQMQNGAEKVILLIDFEGYSMRNTPSIKMMREALTILQARLAICINAPMLFHTFYKIIKPFIDKNTVQKIYFFKVPHPPDNNPEWIAFAQQVFDWEQLEVDYGGKQPISYNPNEYFQND
eukprot:jgi/Galph1/1577/GphlegSOOS_G259.1